MSDDQMWRPSDGVKTVTVGQMFDLAQKFRVKASTNPVARETFEGIAQELDELFGFDSQLTLKEARAR